MLEYRSIINNQNIFQVNINIQSKGQQMKRGLIIAFEGLDKTGKTTHSRLLNRALNSSNVPSKLIRFPNRLTELGKLLDKYLKKQIQFTPEVSHLLFSANRWEIKDSIHTDITQGYNLILDRYIWSGVAYSSALGIDYNWARMSDKGLPLPRLTFLMRCKDAQKLQEKEGFGDERYEKGQFQRKVMLEYDRIVRDNTESQVMEIDSQKSIEQNHQLIFRKVMSLIQVSM